MADEVTEGGATVGNLADLLPTSQQPQRRALTGFLESIREPKAPGEAGGVPVPAWECFRAVLGGAARRDLEDAHAPKALSPTIESERLYADNRMRAASADGTHLPPGLHIVTGQTGGGKSALVVNLAHAAAAAGHPVLYVSLELDGAEIAARFLGLASGVPWYKLALRKPLGPDEDAKRQEGEAALVADGIPERVAVLAPETVDAGLVQREALELFDAFGKVPLVVFDYLQMATVRSADSYRAPLREAVAQVVKELRTLSRHLEHRPDWPGCPVVVLSTTARANVKKSDNSGERVVPGLGGDNPDDLRNADLETLKALPKEAGEVEATAVTAWVVALGDKDAADGSRPLTLRLVKNRLGMPGQWVPFTFHGATGRLEEAPSRYSATAQASPPTTAQALAGAQKSKGAR
jgi:hypothetical protein